MVEIRHAGSADLLDRVCVADYFCGCIFSHNPLAHPVVAAMTSSMTRQDKLSRYSLWEGGDSGCISAEPGRPNTMLGEGKPEMDIGWQLPYTPMGYSDPVRGIPVPGRNKTCHLIRHFGRV